MGSSLYRFRKPLRVG